MGNAGDAELRLALERARRGIDMILGGDLAAGGVAHMLREVGADIGVVRAQLDRQQAHRCFIDEASAQLQWVSDDRGNLIELSRSRWTIVTGQPAKNALGTGWQSVIHPEDLPRYQEAVARASEKRAPYDVAARIRTAESGYRWYRSRSFPKVSTCGKVVRFHGFSEDIHEQVVADEARKKSEERVRTLQADFAHVSRVNEMGQLAAAIAHELNQPLQAICNYVSAAGGAMQTHYGEDSIVTGLLGAASEQTRRATEIIRAMRNLIKHGTGERAPAALDQLIGDAMTLVLIGTKNGDTSIVIEGDCSVAVDVDRAQIQQLMYNLGRNAVEAMTESVEKRLTIRARARGDGFVEVRFIDSGCGLAPEIEERLFTAFMSTKPGGMGVGLTICRRIVEAHGGRIWAESGQRYGATFAFTLPVAQGSAER